MVAGIRGAAWSSVQERFALTSSNSLLPTVWAAIVSGGLFLLLGHWIGVELGDRAAKKKIHEFKEFFILGAAILIGGLVLLYIQWKKPQSAQGAYRLRKKVVEKVAAVEKKVTDKIVQTTEKMVKEAVRIRDHPQAESRAPSDQNLR